MSAHDIAKQKEKNQPVTGVVIAGNMQDQSKAKTYDAVALAAMVSAAWEKSKLSMKKMDESPFRFMDLPPEIRTMIYNYVVTDKTQPPSQPKAFTPPMMKFPEHSIPVCNPTPAITRASRTLREESLHLYWQNNEFAFTLPRRFLSFRVYWDKHRSCPEDSLSRNFGLWLEKCVTPTYLPFLTKVHVSMVCWNTAHARKILVALMRHAYLNDVPSSVVHLPDSIGQYDWEEYGRDDVVAKVEKWAKTGGIERMRSLRSTPRSRRALTSL